MIVSIEGHTQVIVNTDLDGFLSGLLLHHFCGLEVVGFCDSHTHVWLSKTVHSLDEVLFVDIFIASPKVQCVDQHIVAVDKEHALNLFFNPNKSNPNLCLNPRSF